MFVQWYTWQSSYPPPHPQNKTKSMWKNMIEIKGVCLHLFRCVHARNKLALIWTYMERRNKLLNRKGSKQNEQIQVQCSEDGTIRDTYICLLETDKSPSISDTNK